MNAELDAGGYIQTCGLIGLYHEPTEGVISFGRKGASLFQKWIGFDPQHSDCSHWAQGLDEDGRLAIFGKTAFDCFDGLPHSAADKGYVPDDAPVPIGRWCDKWWNRFESGYKLRYSNHPPLLLRVEE